MSVAAVLWALFALFGHFALWVGFVNRLHALGIARSIIKSLSKVSHVATLVIPCAGALATFGWPPDLSHPKPPQLLLGYMVVASGVGVWRLATWLIERPLWRAGWRMTAATSPSRTVDLVERLGHWPIAGSRAKLFSYIPGNQLMRLEIREATVPLPRLPAELAGLSICHISDLHFSGRITIDYYREVVREINALGADIVALTGDIGDRARFFPWIAETLGRVEARHGRLFILGNHDRRTRAIPELRATMGEAGWIDVGGKSRRLPIGDRELLVAGDERPWINVEPVVPSTEERVPRLLLAHTPDRLAWARRHAFDLMLAGHTHGGQIRLPVFGALVCPSWHGVKYSAGLFREGPTLLHVSRGTSSLMPLRWFCPPEMTKLTLTCGSQRTP